MNRFNWPIRVVSLTVIFCFICSQTWAEEIAISTYYPAPYGVYKELTTTGKTFLALDSDGVGIGSDEIGSDEKLKVIGGKVYLEGDTMVVGSTDLVGSTRIQQGDLTVDNNAIICPSALTSWPSGWGSGVHTWDLYSEGTVGVGRNGNLSAYLSGYDGEVEGDHFGPNLNWRITAGDILTGIVTGILALGIFALISSIRYKENITPIENALGKVMRLRGVEFDWKGGGKHDIGMIAEEVGEIIPEVVEYEEDSEYAKVLHYPKLVGLLVEAVKEQQGQIEQLRTEVQTLQAAYVNP